MPDPNAPELNSFAATGSFGDIGTWLPPGNPRGWTYRRHGLAQTDYPKLQHAGYRIPPPYGGINAVYADLRQIWHTMTAATRRTWRRIAKPRHLTPYMAFVRTNSLRAQQGLAPINEP